MSDDIYKTILAAILSASGVLLFELYHRIIAIELDSAERHKYIVVLDNNSARIADQESRIRFLEKSLRK